MDADFIKHIELNFGLRVFQSIDIDRGSADIYLLHTNNGSFVVKLYLTKHTYERVCQELLICDFLRERGVCIPHYISTITNKKLDIFNNRIYTISSYIKGSALNANQFEVEQLEESIFYYFKIVHLLNECPYELRTFNKEKYSIRTVKNAIEYIDCVINCTNKTEVIEIGYRKLKLLKHLETIDIRYLSHLTHLYSHGDFTHFQFIYDSHYHIKAITDWTSVKEMPISYELFRLFIYQIKSYNQSDGSFNINDLVNYISIITKHYRLTAIDILYMPIVYVFISLSQTFFIDLLLNNVNEESAYKIESKLLTQCGFILREHMQIVASLKTFFNEIKQ